VPPAETQEPVSEEEVIRAVSEQEKEATIENTDKASNAEDNSKQSVSRSIPNDGEILEVLKEIRALLESKTAPKPPRARFVFGLFMLLIGLWAANLALFNWIERAGSYYLLGEYARYVCAYGGFAAMIFGAMLINDFLVSARLMNRKVMLPHSNETPYHEAMLCESEGEEEKIVVEQET